MCLCRHVATFLNLQNFRPLIGFECGAKLRDHLLARGQMRFLCIQNPKDGIPLQRRHQQLDSEHLGRLHRRRYRSDDRLHADDLTGNRFRDTARDKKRRKLIEGGALQAKRSKPLDPGGVLCADAVDSDFVEFTGLPPRQDRKRQDVPEWKPEIIHEHLVQRAGRPPLGFGKKSIDVSCAGLEVDIRAKVLDEQIELILVPRNEGLSIFRDLPDLVGDGADRKMSSTRFRVAALRDVAVSRRSSVSTHS